jgi:uncharacterized membrane protein
MDSGMFVPQLILSLVFVLAGYIMMKYPPKKINPLYGYRTGRSMKSQEAWNYAQRVSSRRMMLCGFAGLLVFMTTGMLNCSEGLHAISMIGTLVLSLVYLISSVERDLKKRFPDVNS